MDDMQLSPEAKFIKSTRNAWSMSQEEFGAHIADGWRDTGYTKQAVSLWERDDARLDVYDVAAGSVAYPEGDRRRLFFRELLGLMIPQLKELQDEHDRVQSKAA